MEWDAFSQHINKTDSLFFSSAEQSEEVMLKIGIEQQLIQLQKGRFNALVADKPFKDISLGTDRLTIGISGQVAVPEKKSVFYYQYRSIVHSKSVELK